MGSVKMIQIVHRKEGSSMPKGKIAIGVFSFLLGAMLMMAGCGAPMWDRPSPGGASRNGDRFPDGSENSLSALRRDRDQLKGEVDRLRDERARWDMERRLAEEFLVDLFGALEREDYPQALSSIDRFLRAHPDHPLSRRVSEIRPAMEKLQSSAAEREALREEIRKLKDIQFRFDALRKRGT